MAWHTDNKIAKKYGNDVFKEVPGIIFITYLGDVDDGEFQFIKKSHKLSQVDAYNDYNNEYILKMYYNDPLNLCDRILSYKVVKSN